MTTSCEQIFDDMRDDNVPYWKPGSTRQDAGDQLHDSVAGWLADKGYKDVSVHVGDISTDEEVWFRVKLIRSGHDEASRSYPIEA